MRSGLSLAIFMGMAACSGTATSVQSVGPNKYTISSHSGFFEDADDTFDLALSKAKKYCADRSLEFDLLDSQGFSDNQVSGDVKTGVVSSTQYSQRIFFQCTPKSAAAPTSAAEQAAPKTSP